MLCTFKVNDKEVGRTVDPQVISEMGELRMGVWNYYEENSFELVNFREISSVTELKIETKQMENIKQNFTIIGDGEGEYKDNMLCKHGDDDWNTLYILNDSLMKDNYEFAFRMKECNE